MKTKKEIKQIIKKYGRSYGRIALPYKLRVPGQRRKKTAKRIFPKSLAGKSVLDVGSFLGHMVFHAERFGAERVVGLEVDAKRVEGANAYKEIKGSKAEFINTSALDYPFEESFDYILFLNVLHHIGDPVSLLEKAIPMVKGKLVIEHPARARKKAGIRSGTYPTKEERAKAVALGETPISELIECCKGHFKNFKIMRSPCKSAGRRRKLVVFDND